MENKISIIEQIQGLKGIAEKRSFLNQFSNANRVKAETLNISINEMLALIYKSYGYNDLKTFKQWKEAGYKVRKGEKALIVWGTYNKNVKAKDDQNNGENQDENKGKLIFTVAHVFGANQVEAIEQEEEETEKVA